MSVKAKELRGYKVAVRVSEDLPEQLLISFEPRRPQSEKKLRGGRGRALEFIARVLRDGDKIKIVWDDSPPKKDIKVLQEEAEARLTARMAWLDRLEGLVLSVQRIADELGWAAKRIEKPMEDSYLGNYEAKALLLQKETARVLLDPAGHSAPGAEGVVDFYLLPGYDDIATLYYYDGGWHLHYRAPRTSEADGAREAEAKPLSKAAMRKVLEEMTKNAQ